MKKTLSKIELLLSDYLEVLSGKRNPMVPPKRIVNINAGDSIKIGKRFLKHFIKLGELSRDAKVLDVGSGFGRMAVPLTDYLSSDSQYEGLEILSSGVNWCSKNITSRFKNFRFQKLDVKNGRYNPTGKTLAADYKFPFEDETFDFVILTSVFSHMLPADLENYLSEISRVLKPEGRCFITYFILNDESIRLINNGRSSFNLEYSYENCRIERKEDPEFVIAYPEHLILDLYEKYKLKFHLPHYGRWCGRKNFTSYQDIIIGEKKSNNA